MMSLIRLDEIAKINYGKNLPTKNLTENGYPVFGANGQIGFYSKYLYENEQLLISCRGAYSGKINFSLKQSFVTNNSLIVDFPIHEKELRKFYYYILQGANKNHLVTGTAQPQVTINNAIELKVPLPPLLEQNAIVSKIEQLFSELDNGIENLKTAQAKLKIYRQAVLKKAFEGELTRKWREQQANLSTADELLEMITQEREAHYQQQLEAWKQAIKEWETNDGEGKKPSKPKKQKTLDDLSEQDISELPKLEKFWKWTTIDNLISFEPNAIKAGPFGSSLKKSSYTETGYKIYGQEQVISGNPYYGDYYVDEKKYKELSSCRIKPDDVLISLVGTVGKVLILPNDTEDGIINPRLIKVELHKKHYLSKMFKYYFESGFLKNIYEIYSHGATMNIITMGIIQALPYPICSLQEQYQIVQEIESRLSVCDKIEETISNSLLKAEALRQSILKKAFEGNLLTTQELEVIHGHPDYESAEELLKRIKQERSK